MSNIFPACREAKESTAETTAEGVKEKAMTPTAMVEAAEEMVPNVARRSWSDEFLLVGTGRVERGEWDGARGGDGAICRTDSSPSNPFSFVSGSCYC